MNFAKKCPLFLLLVISGFLFTVTGIVGKNTIYNNITLTVPKDPFLSLVMKGFGYGIYPWDTPVIETAAKAAEVGGGQAPSLNPDDADFLFPLAPVAEEEVQAAAVPEETPAEEKSYTFSQVTEDYFNDALFIGDSRTVGMFEYGGLEERADFYAKTSLTIYSVLDAPLADDEGGTAKITVDEALQRKQFGKIYLMLGINEIGTGTVETFIQQYRGVVERIRTHQPEAIIFVQGIMRVTQEKSDNDPLFNNMNINARNEELAKLSDNKHIFYIDVNEVVTDESGSLNAEYTGDGIHLKAAYYQLWKQLLLERGIVKE